MRIYCDCCDKVQLVKVDDCKDIKTGELYQDIVCSECDLVIAAGTGIKRKWQDLTDEEMKSIQMQSWNKYPGQNMEKFDAWKCQELTQSKLREKNA